MMEQKFNFWNSSLPLKQNNNNNNNNLSFACKLYETGMSEKEKILMRFPYIGIYQCGCLKNEQNQKAPSFSKLGCLGFL
jgi:hypothetical protein